MTKRQLMTLDYLGGMSQNQLAAKYGWTPGAVQTSLNKWGVKLPPEERARRLANACRSIPRHRPGRPSAWPDCPPEKLADYRTMAKYYPAHEARAMLEAV